VFTSTLGESKFMRQILAATSSRTRRSTWSLKEGLWIKSTTLAGVHWCDGRNDLTGVVGLLEEVRNGGFADGDATVHDGEARLVVSNANLVWVGGREEKANGDGEKSRGGGIGCFERECECMFRVCFSRGNVSLFYFFYFTHGLYVLSMASFFSPLSFRR